MIFLILISGTWGQTSYLTEVKANFALGFTDAANLPRSFHRPVKHSLGTDWSSFPAVSLHRSCAAAPVPARAGVGASTTLQPLRESLRRGSYVSVSVEVQKYIMSKSLLFILRTPGVNLQPSSQLGPNPGPSRGISHREQLSRFWL